MGGTGKVVGVKLFFRSEGIEMVFDGELGKERRRVGEELAFVSWSQQ